METNTLPPTFMQGTNSTTISQNKTNLEIPGYTELSNESQWKPMAVTESSAKPIMAKESPRKSSHATESSAKPIMAKESPRKSSHATESSAKPIMAKESPRKSSHATESSAKPIMAKESPRKSSHATESSMKQISALALTETFNSSTDSPTQQNTTKESPIKKKRSRNKKKHKDKNQPKQQLEIELLVRQQASIESPVKQQPAIESPVKQQPDMESPVEQQIEIESPIKQQPSIESPVKQQPAIESPVKQHPAIESPVKQQPAIESPVKQQPSIESPVEQQPAMESPVEQQPAMESTVEQQPDMESPVEQQPAMESPVEQQPAMESPVEQQQSPTDSLPKQKTATDFSAKQKPMNDNLTMQKSDAYTSDMQKPLTDCKDKQKPAADSPSKQKTTFKSTEIQTSATLSPGMKTSDLQSTANVDSNTAIASVTSPFKIPLPSETLPLQEPEVNMAHVTDILSFTEQMHTAIEKYFTPNKENFDFLHQQSPQDAGNGHLVYKEIPNPDQGSINIVVSSSGAAFDSMPKYSPTIRRAGPRKGPVLCFDCDGEGCGDPKKECYANGFAESIYDELNSHLSDSSDSTSCELGEYKDDNLESVDDLLDDDIDLSPPPTHQRTLERIVRGTDDSRELSTRKQRRPRPHLSENLKRCLNCRRRMGKLLVCRQCDTATYCSQMCQKEDYQKHRVECKRVVKWNCACHRLGDYMVKYLTNQHLKVITEFRQIPDCYQSLQGYNRAVLCELAGRCDYYPKEDYAIFIRDETGMEIPLVVSVDKSYYTSQHSKEEIPFAQLFQPGRFLVVLHPVWVLLCDFREGLRLTDLRSLLLVKYFSEL
uniref:MYND-type domain-containing protein n=1 Tax=Biomphalaria glabrata TaxID=6526 RepID=A0A2C9LEN6_BIOGL